TSPAHGAETRPPVTAVLGPEPPRSGVSPARMAVEGSDRPATMQPRMSSTLAWTRETTGPGSSAKVREEYRSASSAVVTSASPNPRWTPHGPPGQQPYQPS